MRYNYFWFGKTNPRHIGILIPVSISTTSPQSACHSAPVGQISSKSHHPQQKNDAMSFFKMADLRHLRFYESNDKFFEKPVYDFL